MEQKAPRSVSWRFTPKKLGKEIDNSASVVVGAGVVSQMMFSSDTGGEQRSHVSPGQPTVKAGDKESPAPRVLALRTKEAREGDCRVGVSFRRLSTR